MKVSVVVPTYKRPDLLNRCLAALFAQDFDPNEFEIIVADDAESEQTKKIVEWWNFSPARNGSRPSLRYVATNGTHGPAATRNTGWRAAQGEIIAFTDDDCIPDPRWLQSGVNRLKNGVAGVQGRIVMPLPDSPTDYELDASHLRDSEFVTANCFVRREVLAAAGGFDERFRLAWREDSDLYFTLLELNELVAHASDAIVVHPIRPAEWGVSMKQQHKAMFNALLYKKHPEIYRARIQASPPMHYYFIVTALLIAFGLQLAGMHQLAMVGFTVWLLLTGFFCGRRLWRTSHSLKHVAEMIVTSIFIPPLALYWRLRGAAKFKVPFL